MGDPVAYMLYMLRLAQEQHAAASIFNTITFWLIIGIMAPILIKLLLAAAEFSRVKKGLIADKDKYKQSPLGPFGMFFGIPAFIPRSKSEIESEKQYAYKKWGTTFSATCIACGLFLFIIAVIGNADSNISAIGKIKNVTPGTILFIIGFLFRKTLQRQKSRFG